MRRKLIKKPIKKNYHSLDNLHRVICIVTLLGVVGIFIYVINLSSVIADAIAKGNRDFIEMRDRVRGTESLVSDLTKVSLIRQENISAINSDILRIKGQLENIDTKLSDLQKPTTQPNK